MAPLRLTRQERWSDRGAARLTAQPLTFALAGLVLVVAVGLGGYLAGRPPESSAGQSSAAGGSTSTSTTQRVHGPQLPPAGSHLSFDATFAGSTLDTGVWATCYWFGLTAAGCGHTSAYPELQWYLPSQAQVSDGALRLVASPTPTAGTDAQGQPETYQCRSGMVTTAPSFNFTYGYVQFVARLPKGPNAWPAIWMLPSNHARSLPEIDIVEMLGRSPDQPFVTFHPAVGLQQQRDLTTADLSSGWHTFGLDWEPGSLTWYIDGNAVLTITANVPSQPMYLLANLAVTNVVAPLQLPGSCSASLDIQSVQVWQQTPA